MWHPSRLDDDPDKTTVHAYDTLCREISVEEWWEAYVETGLAYKEWNEYVERARYVMAILARNTPLNTDQPGDYLDLSAL